MADESYVNMYPVPGDPGTQKEWSELVRSRAVGGTVQLPTVSYLRLFAYALTFSDISELLQVQDDIQPEKSSRMPVSINRARTKPPEYFPGNQPTQEKSMPRLKLPAPKPRAPLPGKSSGSGVVLQSVKDTAKGTLAATLGYTTIDALADWAEDNPETKSLLEAILERGGLAFDELMSSEDGRQILIREAAKLNAPVKLDKDARSKLSSKEAPDDEDVPEGDKKYDQILRVLNALNITSSEYIVLLDGLRSHTPDDVVAFVRTRERFGLTRM